MQPGRVPARTRARTGTARPSPLSDASRRLASAHAHTTRHPRPPRLRARPGHRQLADRHGRPHGARGGARARAAVGGAEARLLVPERGRQGQRRRRPGVQLHRRGRRRRPRAVDLRGQRALGRGGRDRHRRLGQGRRQGQGHHAPHRRRQGLRDRRGRRRDRPRVRAAGRRRADDRHRQLGDRPRAPTPRAASRLNGNGSLTWVFDSQDEAHEFAAHRRQQGARRGARHQPDHRHRPAHPRRRRGPRRSRRRRSSASRAARRSSARPRAARARCRARPRARSAPRSAAATTRAPTQTTVYFKVNESGKAGGELFKPIGGRGLGEGEVQLAVTVDSNGQPIQATIIGSGTVNAPAHRQARRPVGQARRLRQARRRAHRPRPDRPGQPRGVQRLRQRSAGRRARPRQPLRRRLAGRRAPLRRKPDRRRARGRRVDRGRRVWPGRRR